MAKALLPAALIILLILAACSDPSPTAVVEPTAAPQPQATTPAASQLEPTQPAEPTATSTPQPIKTPTTVPTPGPLETPSPALRPTATTAPPQDQSPAGRLTPLVLDGPEAVASQLSNQELACLAGVADVERLLSIFNYPGMATAGEQTELIGCLQDETLTRMFLTGLIQGTEPLSTETSACVRIGFREIDLRSVMLAGLQGDPGTAMSGSMAALFLTMACLNSEEWNAIAHAVDMRPDDREGMQCLLEEMGGPQGMAAALGAEGQGGFTALFAAAAGCRLEMGGPPGQVPPAVTATPEPSATPASAATPTTEPPETPEPTSTATPEQPPRPSGLWRGITVASEDRCSPYDSDDYHYSPSVEPRIVDAQGGIYGPYTGTWFGDIRETDIEHIVARSEAHDSGLYAADADTKDRFAADILNLTLASPSVNRHQKVDKDAAEWLPDLNACWYVDRVVQVRLEYGLTIDQAEADAIDEVLAGCNSTEMVVLAPTDSGAPQATATPTPTSIPAADVDTLAKYDDDDNGRISCAEARAHGIAPVRRGHPAYQYMNDRDGDGVVCE